MVSLEVILGEDELNLSTQQLGVSLCDYLDRRAYHNLLHFTMQPRLLAKLRKPDVQSPPWNSRLGSIGTAFGGVHLVISLLRLVAFMYNRQQKWLTEDRLPDLKLLRRMFGLGPPRLGDVTMRGSGGEV